MVDAPSVSTLVFFFYSSGAHRDLHSFPTRRSSDLAIERAVILADGGYIRSEHLPVSATRKASPADDALRSEEHTSELQSRGHLVCRLLLEKKKKPTKQTYKTEQTTDHAPEQTPPLP